MGSCCSLCCGSDRSDDDNNKNGTVLSAAELELQVQKEQADLKSLSFARGMSAASIEVENRTTVGYDFIDSLSHPICLKFQQNFRRFDD